MFTLAFPRIHVLGASSATARSARLRTWVVAYVRIKRHGLKIGSQQPYFITLQANRPWPGPKKNSYHTEICMSCDRMTEVSLYNVCFMMVDGVHQKVFHESVRELIQLPAQTTEARQPVASAAKEIVPLMHLALFSEGRVTGRPARDVSLECAPIGGDLCASAFQKEMTQTSKLYPTIATRYCRKSLVGRGRHLGALLCRHGRPA
uniref:Uncharacterized protein n=1 Tax=Rhipicephalus pulchellus TaxID=72859 RepID=L7LUN7_RHIPC